MSRYTTFKHWIFNKDKKPYYIDAFDNVLVGDINTLKKPDGQLATLQHAPTGWKDVLIKYGRNNKYLGMFRDFTVPLKFALDGAHIIKDLMWPGGFEGVSYYGLSKWDRYAFPPQYKVYYLGEIDLSKLKQSRETVEVTVLEGGVAKYLKAYEGVVQEIPVATDLEAIDVFMDGLPFNNKIEWSIYDQNVGSLFSNSDVAGMGIIVQEGTSQGILSQDTPSDNFDVNNENLYFHKSLNKTYTVRVHGTLLFDSLFTDHTVTIKKYNYTSLATTDYLIGTGPVGSGVQYDFDFSIPMIPNDALFLHFETSNVGFIAFNAGNPSTFFVNYEVTFDPTFVKAITPFRLFQLLTEKVTEGKYQCESSYLRSMTELVYTSGMCIRNFFDENGIIRISFNDFFQSLRQFGVMLFIKNDVLYIEQIADAYQSNIIADLGVVSNLTIDVAEDKIYNSLKVGYPNQTYDNVNGLDEFNNTQVWTLPVLKVPKELDLVSPVRADMYGIELTRLNLNGKTTTDSKSDNDTFFLSVKPNQTFTFPVDMVFIAPNTIEVTGNLSSLGYYIKPGAEFTVIGSANNEIQFTIEAVEYNINLIIGSAKFTVTGTVVNETVSADMSFIDYYILNRPAYTSITGLLHPDKAFNVPLSPKAGLLRNGSFLRSFLHDPALLVKYKSSEKNSELSHTIDGVTLTQKEDIAVNDLGAPLYYPYYLEFETEVPVNFMDIMKTNPHGTIQFKNEKGDTLYGFLEDGGVKPATMDKSRWKLLMSPLTDLNLLKK